MASMIYKITRTTKAEIDIASIREYTLKNYGSVATKAYLDLLRQTFKDLLSDPFRPGSKERPDIAPLIRSYHISLSKRRTSSNFIKKPRHIVFYFLSKPDEIVVLRILHDSADLQRHLPSSKEI